jgi:glutathione S-transferase
MSDGPALILHHYPASPFSEKIRKVLAHKRLAWHAVEQPSIMPKPDLVPLTGGYRRIPVLQIGADVWCDTQLIVRVIERLHPSPTLHPGGSEGTCHAWNLWADRLLFWHTVAVVFADLGPLVPKEFVDDRTKMIPGRDFAEVPKLAPHAKEQLRALFAILEAQLADERRYLLGADFSLADAACFHPLWFLRVAPSAPALLEEFGRLRAWTARVAELGEGDPRPMTPAEALAVAKAARPAPASGIAGAEPNALAIGHRIAVTADDYAFDPVVGELVAASATEIAVRRSDPALGDLVVHFPRFGYRVTEA